MTKVIDVLQLTSVVQRVYMYTYVGEGRGPLEINWMITTNKRGGFFESSWSPVLLLFNIP